MGEGLVDDVTTHPATRAMVDEYVAWYDRHFDPAWADIMLTPADGRRARAAGPACCRKRRRSRRHGPVLSPRRRFLSAGNITHTPAYGNLIALGVLAAVQERDASPKQIADARAYREMIARTGRFLTFSGGGATIGYRMRQDPATRAALKIVRETDAGLVISGRLGMHTSPAYAEDVYIGGLHGRRYRRPPRQVRRAGRRARASRCSAARSRRATPTRSSRRCRSRYDELDGQMWLDDVFVPWERVFLLEADARAGRHAGCSGTSSMAGWRRRNSRWAWRSRAPTRWVCSEHEPTIEYLVDLVIEVQTVRTLPDRRRARSASSRRQGYCLPEPPPSRGRRHRDAEGAAADGGDPAHRAGLVARRGADPTAISPRPRWRRGWRKSFGGGGYTALQRAALLQLAWDHVSSALDGRESAFELHANGGMPDWRGRLRRNFERYNELANAVLRAIGCADAGD